MSRRKVKPLTTHDVPKRVPRGRVLLLCVVLAAATLIVYGPSFRAEFLTIDDGVYVTANPAVQAGLTAGGARWAFGIHESNWHPLTWISLMADASLGGAHPRVFHATNVVLHLVNTLLLFAALLAMTRRTERSATVSLLFAVHPLHVESVAWIAERKDVLSGLFFMLGLLAWTAYVKRPSALRYGLVAVVFALGLMSKPMIVTLPVVLILLDRWPLARTAAWPRLIWEKAPLFLMSAASSIVTMLAQRQAMSEEGVFPLSVRVANAVVAYACYLKDMVWPSGLAFFYPYPSPGPKAGEVLVSGLLLAALTVGAVRTARARPYLAVGWAWYLVTLVPVIGIVQVGLQARADRYTYLPLIGPFIAIVWGASELATRIADIRLRKAAILAAALVCGALLVAARVEAGYWHDSVTLYERALRVTKDNAVAHNDLALALLERGDLDGTILHGREALQLDPGQAEAPNSVATALTRKGRPQEAISVYREALLRRPGDVTLHSNLGTVLADQGDVAGATAEFKEATRLDPSSASAHYNMGVLLARLGRYDEAIEELSTAERLDPFDPDIGPTLDRARALRGASPR